MSLLPSAREVVEAVRIARDRPFKSVKLNPFAAVVQHQGETWQQFLGVNASTYGRETAANLNRAYELGRQSPHREQAGGA